MTQQSIVSNYSFAFPIDYNSSETAPTIYLTIPEGINYIRISSGNGNPYIQDKKLQIEKITPIYKNNGDCI